IIDSFTALNNAIFVPIYAPGPFGTLIYQGIQVIPIPVPVGGTTTGYPATVQVLDRITATNRFNGGVFGLRYELRYGMWDLMTIGKVGIGNMHQTLDIYGHTAFANIATGQTGGSYGGLLANASNIGRYNNDEFAVIPELTANLGIHVTRSIQLFAGYNFIWISRVARPGLQVSPVVDSSTVPFHPNYGQLGRPPAPRQLFVQDELWIHGVNFGMQIRY
ncbi:MAG: BBP7 family outer membrane beta-barrel protein, partial [Gemmataceae bacterium]|nr:BBP7 family outer membrane beta-barrel protein [Gemmataceae bacterium]MDW8244626.1 BBP7 family outer membrane beta-barrel protein [Thermogemmata sp.]